MGKVHSGFVVMVLRLGAPGLVALALLLAAGQVSSGGAGAGILAIALVAAVIAQLIRRQRRTTAETAVVAEIEEASETVARLSAQLAALRKEKAEAERGHRAVLDLLPDPLILIDRDHGIRLINRAARGLFGDAAPGRPLAAVLRHPEVLESVDAVIDGEEAEAEIELSLPVPVARELTCSIAAFDKPLSDGIVAALVFRDHTQSKRVERMRADFVANASHEIRTPLAALGGYIETLLGPAKDDPVARARFLTTMAAQVERMTRLVSDLLSLSRVELTEHTPPDDPVSLPIVLRRVVQSLEFRAQAKDCKVDIVLPEKLPAVVGDEGELEQVFTNLIDNAIKYGRQGGTVRVEARLIDHVPARSGWTGDSRPVSIAITDQGPGIAREHLPRLTERFYRVDAARSRDLGGTGLGLAIVKHIVNRHRGALTIDSTVGVGTVFTIYLPAKT